jgi:hypothetical protein
MPAMGTEVTLERYAEIRAEMEAGVPRDQALARAGLTVEAWTVAQREWLAGMGAEIARGRFDLTNRYTTAFLARQRAVPAAEPITLPASPSPLPRVVAPDPSPPPAPLPSPPERAEARPLPPPRPPPAKPTFLVAAESPAPPPAAPAVRPPAPPPPAGRPPVMTPNPLLMSTLPPDTVPGEASPLRAALPFQAARAAPPAGSLPAPAAPRRNLPPVQRTTASLSATTAGLVVRKDAVLPFQNATPPKPAGPPAPPRPAAPPGPSLTLEQYASLCVEMALDPGRSGETLHRYGLTGEQASDVDAQWKARVAADPNVRAAFDLAYASYRAWRMAAHGKPPAT